MLLKTQIGHFDLFDFLSTIASSAKEQDLELLALITS